MLKILVTGGAGFIGSHVVEALLSHGHEVVVLDDLSTGKLENLPSENRSLKFVEGSILNPEKVSEVMRGCEAVIHLAAIASVQASIDDPQATHRVNFDGTLLLLEEARKIGVRRFLFASSAAVYGNVSEGAVSESAPLSPLTPYAADKLACEYYLGHYYRNFGIEYTAFRFFNVYGPRQDPSSPYSGVISIFASNGMAGKPLKIYGDGNQTRDFVFVKNLSEILVNSIHHGKTYGQTVNIGTGASVSLLEIVSELTAILNKRVELEYHAARKGEVRHSLADISLLRSLFPGLRFTSIADGLKEAISNNMFCIGED